MTGGWLRDTWALYRRVFSRGGALTLRHWPVGLIVIVYGVLLSFGFRLVAPLGFVGGVLLYLLMMACLSSWLSLVAEVIGGGRVRWGDVLPGFVTYLGDLLTVGFILWGVSLIAQLVLAPFPFLHLLFVLAAAVFLNAVPELIYLGRHAPAELLVESYRFIGENWIEWFPPNLALAACVIATAGLPDGLIESAGEGIALYFAMLVRGLLFSELSGSSRRAREFRRRAAG